MRLAARALRTGSRDSKDFQCFDLSKTSISTLFLLSLWLDVQKAARIMWVHRRVSSERKRIMLVHGESVASVALQTAIHSVVLR